MKVQVNSDLEKKINSELCDYGDHIVLFILASLNFPNLDLKTLQNAITEARKADAALGNGKLSTQYAMQKRNILEAAITQVTHNVEDVANNPNLPDEDRKSIIVSAGMVMKKKTQRQKNHFVVKQGALSGMALLVAKGIRGAHLWEYTLDTTGLTGWIQVKPTIKASAEIDELQSLTRYAFRHYAITGDKSDDWEDPVFFTVM